MQDNNVTWFQGNNLLLDVVAPLDHIDPSVPAVMDSATTVQAHLFSKEVKSTATGAESAAALTITLEKVVGLAVGDVLTIEETDGSFTRHPVTIIDTATNLVTFTTGLAAGSAVGARVWKTYGSAVVTGAFYGTAATDTTTWGYVFDFAYTYDAKLRRGLRLEAMAVLHKTSTGAHYTRTWDVIVAEALGAP